MNLEIEENYAGKYPLRNPLINTYCYFEESRI